MTSTSKQRRLAARHAADTRSWAATTARCLALYLAHDEHPPVTPYNLGVVLRKREIPLVELPARCSADRAVITVLAPKKAAAPPLPPETTWLVTSERLVGRINGSVLRWWDWGVILGCQVQLTPGNEHVQLDPNAEPPVIWWGPGVAPLAVAAIYHLHGPAALLEHPGLAVLRGDSRPTREPPVRRSRRLTEEHEPDLRPRTAKIFAGVLGKPPIRDWWM